MIFKAILQRLDSDVWGHYVAVPQDIVETLTKDKNKRVICLFKGAYRKHCALMPKGDGTFFINVRKELHTKLGIQLGDEIELTIEKDTSKYGMPMPEEMAELLAIDEEGNTLFHALTLGKQRSLLHIIGKPKNSDTRLRKALVIIDFLKHNSGILDFKLLNQAFKDSKGKY